MALYVLVCGKLPANKFSTMAELEQFHKCYLYVFVVKMDCPILMPCLAFTNTASLKMKLEPCDGSATIHSGIYIYSLVILWRADDGKSFWHHHLIAVVVVHINT